MSNSYLKQKSLRVAVYCRVATDAQIDNKSNDVSVEGRKNMTKFTNGIKKVMATLLLFVILSTTTGITNIVHAADYLVLKGTVITGANYNQPLDSFYQESAVISSAESPVDFTIMSIGTPFAFKLRAISCCFSRFPSSRPSMRPSISPSHLAVFKISFWKRMASICLSYACRSAVVML